MEYYCFIKLLVHGKEKLGTRSLNDTRLNNFVNIFRFFIFIFLGKIERKSHTHTQKKKRLQQNSKIPFHFKKVIAIRLGIYREPLG